MNTSPQSRAALALAMALCLTACGDRDTTPTLPPPAPSSPAAPAPAPTPAPAPATDQWIGQWNGPEGTSVLITGGEGQYELTIRNLDGPRTFIGAASGDKIAFERDSKLETLQRSDGAGTGMKWLADKKDCLRVRVGEGYCRD